MNKVTVVIPYYKKKKYIKSALRSALNQTYKNIEVLLIFDESKKDNLEFINELIKIDKRIKLIINKKNKGAGFSRNIGIQKSKGQYIAFLDSDDLWNKKKIQFQLNYMTTNDYGITHTSYDIINSDGIVIGKRKARNFLKLNDLIKSCDIGLSTIMIKKELFNNKLLFPDLKTKEDFVLWLKFLINGNKIFGISKSLSKWRETENALSNSTIQKLKDGFKVYNKYMKFNLIKSTFFLFFLSINFIKKKLND